MDWVHLILLKSAKMKKFEEPSWKTEDLSFRILLVFIEKDSLSILLIKAKTNLTVVQLKILLKNNLKALDLHVFDGSTKSMSDSIILNMFLTKTKVS